MQRYSMSTLYMYDAMSFCSFVGEIFCPHSALNHCHVWFLKAASSAWFMREEGLRSEIVRLEDRIHDLEEEKGELVASTSDNTRPLIRLVSVNLSDFILNWMIYSGTLHRLF